jgi:hypothetical protein
MANQKWKAIVEDWRKVPAGKSHQSVEPSRVCRYDEGEEGGEEEREAVRSTTKKHSPKDREI